MEFWGNLVLLNAATATVLAGIVALAARKLTRSSLVHGLWLLVLVKLVSIPALEIRMPSIAALLPASESAPVSFAPELATLAPAQIASVTARAPDARVAFALLAGLGSVVVLSLAIWRIVRFRRLLRRAAETPARLQERTARLAVSLGLRRAPLVRVVPERIPPAVWPGLGRAEILLPAALLDRLSPEELDALLVHELAHVRRRDHWVRPFELVITALYWWHPVAWWARRNLRVAEEKSCDAVVLRTLPTGSRDYAESLLKTVEFLSTRERPVPALAVGAAETSRLKERVVMILNRDTPAPVSGRVRLVLAGAAIAALLVSPAWVESKAVRHEHDDRAPASAADREYAQRMLAVHRAELRLEKELSGLQLKRRVLQDELDEVAFRLEQDQLQAEAQRLLQAGEELQAAEMRRHLEELQQDVARQLDQSRFEQFFEQKQAELSFQLRELELAHGEFYAEGNEHQSEEIIAKMDAVQRELQELHLEALEAEVRRNQEELDRETARLEKEKQERAGKE